MRVLSCVCVCVWRSWILIQGACPVDSLPNLDTPHLSHKENHATPTCRPACVSSGRQYQRRVAACAPPPMAHSASMRASARPARVSTLDRAVVGPWAGTGLPCSQSGHTQSSLWGFEGGRLKFETRDLH